MVWGRIQNATRRQSTRITEPSQLPPDNALLECAAGHQHLVGQPQLERLVGTPCPWCRNPLSFHFLGSASEYKRGWE